jgi:hypothetical protein
MTRQLTHRGRGEPTEAVRARSLVAIKVMGAAIILSIGEAAVFAMTGLPRLATFVGLAVFTTTVLSGVLAVIELIRLAARRGALAAWEAALKVVAVAVIVETAWVVVITRTDTAALVEAYHSGPLRIVAGVRFVTSSVAVAGALAAAVAVASAVGAALLLAIRALAREVAETGMTVVRRSMRRRSQQGRGVPCSSPHSPPALAERFLLLVLPARLGDPIVGDLAEPFASIQGRQGDRFARIWYWRQAIGAVLRFVGLRVTGLLSLGAIMRAARRPPWL